ncbi:hypothetical protein N6H18_11040 [Reichenbachiella agarivorans]|uniref:Uncharacterized protein n=1 Tax=Reichenbachiella agarivorans TaxID=2979464 RepID=A0ABY6CK33_9BACT|nr:hypothetical protein [Reichenbachiella agarivorans]UXP30887.1 hypothetical protein N6H18_11040 [Reichenbachiella agarivorans]
MKSKKNISLNDIPKKEGFIAPEGFFDSFIDELEQVIDQREQAREANKIPAVEKDWWMAVAASIAVLLIAGVVFWINGSKDEQVTDYWDDVSSEQIAFYLENSALDTETLLEQVDLALLTTDQDELMGLDEVSDEDMNMIIEQYEDIF